MSLGDLISKVGKMVDKVNPFDAPTFDSPAQASITTQGVSNMNTPFIGSSAPVAQPQQKQGFLSYLNQKTDGFFGALGSVAQKPKSVITDEDYEHISNIKSFQSNLNKNVFETTGLRDFVTGDGWGKLIPDFLVGGKSNTFKKGNFSELKTKMDELSTNYAPSEEYKFTASQINLRYNKRLQSLAKQKLQEEIKSGAVRVDNADSRMEQLYTELGEDVYSEMEKEFEALDAIKQKELEENKKALAEEYINPTEIDSALSIYENNYSGNSEIRTQQYIREKIVRPLMDEVLPMDNWTAATASDQTYKKMESRFEEAMVRDYANYYNSLAAVKSEEDKQRIKDQLAGQIEARKKYFSNVMSDYQKQLNEKVDAGEELSDIDKGDLIRQAYKNSSEILSPEERRTLLVASGADLMTRVLVDNAQMRDNIDSLFGKNINPKDRAKALGGVTWNLAQQAVGLLEGGISTLVSGVANDTFKKDEERRLYLDEYELAKADWNIAQAALYNVVYNPDDIVETVAGIFAGNYFTGVNKIDKGVTGLRRMSKLLKNTGVGDGSRVLRYTANGLIMAAKPAAYAAKGIGEGVVANTIMDAKLRAAETDANLALNLVSDAFLEPVFRGFGKTAEKLGKKKIDQVGIGAMAAGMKSNRISQSIFATLLGEESPSNAAKEIQKYTKETQGKDISTNEALAMIRTGRDFVWASSSEKAVGIVNGKSDVDMQNLYRNIADNWEKIQEASKVGSDKVYTPDGTILKFSDMTTEKFKYGNEAQNVFQILTSKTASASDKNIAQVYLEGRYANIPKFIDGEYAQDSVRINIPKAERAEIKKAFEEKIERNRNIKDMYVRAEDFVKIESEVIELKLKYSGKNGRASIQVFEPFSTNSRKIYLDQIETLVKDPEGKTKFLEMIFQGKINLDTEQAMALGFTKTEGKGVNKVRTGKAGTYYATFDKNFADELKTTNVTAYNLVKSLLASTEKNVATSLDYSPDNINELKDALDKVFGEGNISFVNANQLKTNNPGVTDMRQLIADNMKQQDAYFSIGYGTLFDKQTQQTKNIFYIGAGKKLQEEGFDISGPFQEYHKKSNEILRDIMSQPDFQTGISFAMPIHHIDKMAELTPEYKTSLLKQELKKAGKVDDEGNLTKEGQQIYKYILDHSINTNTTDHLLATFSFELFANGIVNNFALYKKAFSDLKKLKEALKNGTPPNDILLSAIESYRLLSKAFIGERTSRRAASKFKDSFDTSNFEKEAAKKYDEILFKKDTALQAAQEQLFELTTRVYLPHEKELRDIRIKIANERIANINKTILDKKTYIKRYVDGAYKLAFDTILRQNFDSLFDLLSLPQKELLSNASNASLTKKIKTISQKIENIKITNKEKLSLSDKKELALELKNLKKEYRETQKQLSTIETSLQTEVKLLKDIKGSKENKKLIEDFFLATEDGIKFRKEKSLYDMMKFFSDNEKMLAKNPELTRYIIENVIHKTPIAGKQGELFSQDALRFFGKEELLMADRTIQEGYRDYNLAMEENPIVKGFQGAISASGNGSEAQLGEDLLFAIKESFGGGEAKSLQEFYFENEKFRKNIQLFRASGSTEKKALRSTYDAYEEFKTFIDKYISDIDFKLVKNGSVKSKEESLSLLKNDDMYEQLFKKFKALSDNVNNKTVIKKTNLSNPGDVYPDFQLTKTEQQIGKTSIFVRELQEKFGPDVFRTISIGRIGDLEYLTYTGPKGETLKYSTAKNAQMRLKQLEKAFYFSGPDKAKQIALIINNRYKETQHQKKGEEFAEQLGLKEGEFIMGTFGDKNNTLIIYKSELTDFNQVLEEYTPQYARHGGFLYEENKEVLIAKAKKELEENIKNKVIKSYTEEDLNDLVIQYVNKYVTDIVKREASLQSESQIFEGIKIPIKGYVIGKRFHGDKIKSFLKEINSVLKSKPTSSPEFMEKFLDRIKELDPTFSQKDFFINRDFQDFVNYANTTYGTDTEDGASYISKNLRDIYDAINRKKTTGKSMKFHLSGMIDGMRLLGKSLFNISDTRMINEDGTATIMDNAIFLGESSAKLKGGIKMYPEGVKKTVIIDGVKYEVIGEIEGLDTTFFKNAASEAIEESDEETLTSQIVNLMNMDNLHEYEDYVKNQIEDAYAETIGNLGNPELKLPTFGEIERYINELNNIYQVGGMSDPMVESRIKMFLDKTKQILLGNKVSGSSMYIKNSIIKFSDYKGAKIKGNKKYLEQNELLVSEESSIWKDTIKQIDDQIEELSSIQDLSPTQKEKLDFLTMQKDTGTYWVSAFRSPIPNRENIGAYKLISAEKIGINNKKFKYLDKDDVVGHPESLYIKLQADADGDHLVTIPIVDTPGILIAKTAFNLGKKDSIYSFLSGDPKNKIAIILQVDEVSQKQNPISIFEQRFKAVDAKESISNVMGTLRTINIFSMYMGKVKEDFEKGLYFKRIIDPIKIRGFSIVKEKFHGTYVAKSKPIVRSLSSIIDKVADLEGWIGDEKYTKFISISENFSSQTGSTVQKALDFAKDKSGKPFPKEEWIEDFMNAIGIQNPETIRFLFNEVFSPLSMVYKKTFEENLTPRKMTELWFNKGKKYSKDENVLFLGSLGFNRDMIEYLNESKIMNKISTLMNATEKIYVSQKIISRLDSYNFDQKDTVAMKSFLDLVSEEKFHVSFQLNTFINYAQYPGKSRDDIIDIIIGTEKQKGTQEIFKLENEKDFLNNLILAYPEAQKVKENLLIFWRNKVTDVTKDEYHEEIKIFDLMKKYLDSLSDPKITKVIQAYQESSLLATKKSGRIDNGKLFRELGKKINLEDQFNIDMASIYAYADGKKTLFNLLSADERINVLQYADMIRNSPEKEQYYGGPINPNYRPAVYLERLPEESDIKKQLRLDKEELETELLRIKERGEQINLELQKEGIENTSDLESELSTLAVQKETVIKNLKSIRDFKKAMKPEELFSLSDKEIKELEDMNKAVDMPYAFKKLDITYQIGEEHFKYLNADIRNLQGLDALVQEGMHLKAEGLLSKYLPDIMEKNHAMRNIFGAGRVQLMKKSFLDFTTKLRKDLGIDPNDMEEIVSAIQSSVRKSMKFNKYEENAYIFDLNEFKQTIESKASFIDSKTGRPTGPLAILTDNQKQIIMASLDEFYEKQVKNPEYALNVMHKRYKDRGGYILNYSDNFAGSFISDLIGALDGDLQWEFRRRGVITMPGNAANDFKDQRREFMQYVRDNAQKGIKIKTSELNPLFDIMFMKEIPWYIRGIGWANNWSYFWNYQAGSLFLGGVGHIPAVTQIIGNTLELIGYMRATNADTKDAVAILEGTGALKSEGTFLRGSGMEVEPTVEGIGRVQKFLSDNTKDSLRWGLKKLGMKDELLANKIANFIDTMVLDPMQWTDGLLDPLRKVVAMKKVMTSLNIKSHADFMKKYPTSKEQDAVIALVNREHAAMGGGVNSTSTIMRYTRFNMTNSQLPMYLRVPEAIVKKLFGFLNGWSFHKFATFAEKEMIPLYAIGRFRAGDGVAAQTLMKEYIAYNTALTQNILTAMAISMQFQKYDNSESDNEIDPSQFIRGATNTLVALEILFSRELENIQGEEGDTITNRAASTTMGLLSYLTRTLKQNPLKILATTKERVELYGESYPEALRNALISVSSSYVRGSFGMVEGSIYDYNRGFDGIAVLGYGSDTPEDKMFSELVKAKRLGKIDSIGLTGSIAEMLFNYVSPQYSGNDTMLKGISELFKEESIRNLYNHGLGENGYDLKNLMYTEGEFDPSQTDQLWKELITYNSIGTDFDSKMRKQGGGTSDAINVKMDELITKQLEDMGYTKADLMNSPTYRTEALQKLYFEVSQGKIPELSTKHLIPYIAEQKLKDMEKNAKNYMGISSKDRYYFETDEKAYLKSLVLSDMAKGGLLDQNLNNIYTVLGLHIKKNKPELSKLLKDGKQTSALGDYLDALAISTRNLQEGDTSAKYLTTRYAAGFRSLLDYYDYRRNKVEPTATAMEISYNAGINFIEGIYNSDQDNKTKLAKIASVLQGMNDSTWNLFKDDTKFNLLTKEAQKKLISWVYKVNDEIQDYDQDSIANYQLTSSYSGGGYGGKKSKYTPNYYRKGMSSPYTSGPRPGFSKQFPALPTYLEGKTIPQNYNKIATGYLPEQKIQLRYLQFPAVAAINGYFIRRSIDTAMYGPNYFGGSIIPKENKAGKQDRNIKFKRKQRPSVLSKPKTKRFKPGIMRKGPMSGLPNDDKLRS